MWNEVKRIGSNHSPSVQYSGPFKHHSTPNAPRSGDCEVPQTHDQQQRTETTINTSHKLSPASGHLVVGMFASPNNAVAPVHVCSLHGKESLEGGSPLKSPNMWNHLCLAYAFPPQPLVLGVQQLMESSHRAAVGNPCGFPECTQTMTLRAAQVPNSPPLKDTLHLYQFFPYQRSPMFIQELNLMDLVSWFLSGTSWNSWIFFLQQWTCLFILYVIVFPKPHWKFCATWLKSKRLPVHEVNILVSCRIPHVPLPFLQGRGNHHNSLIFYCQCPETYISSPCSPTRGYLLCHPIQWSCIRRTLSRWNIPLVLKQLLLHPFVENGKDSDNPWSILLTKQPLYRGRHQQFTVTNFMLYLGLIIPESILFPGIRVPW